MNTACQITEREQFRLMLLFSESVLTEVFGRGDAVPRDLDDRLRALAEGRLNPRERSRLVEELAKYPELVHRLAEYLREQPLGDD